MKLRRVTTTGLLAALAIATTPFPPAMAAEAAPASKEELRAAMTWLLPQWDDAREQALQAKEAAAAGAGYYTTPLHVPGSDRSYTRNQINSTPPDWWPQDHPPMPAIVGAGKDKAMACAACHQPDGAGTATSASLVGLSESYLIEQVDAFRSGARINSDMHTEALAVSEGDLHVAAAFYSSLHPAGPRVKVTEVAQVPVTHVETWMLVPTPGAGTEAIGNRIIEIPQDVARARILDGRVPYVAYVPPGSVENGKRLVNGGAGAQSCVTCHGGGLRGSAVAPPLAGRSPTYIARQLVGFATGDRSGPANAPMQAVAAKLTLGDMIAVAAYAASLPP